MNIIYIIKSLNTYKYYINSSNYKYTSLILHKFINSYKKYIINKNNFNKVYNIIDFNDVYIEELEKTNDDIIEKINNYIINNPNVIEETNNIIFNNLEINIIKNKKDKKIYLKNYYEEHKKENINKVKEYYEENKIILKRKSKINYIKNRHTNLSNNIDIYI